MNHSPRHSQPVVSRRRYQGFSLLELLIVLALFSVVMGAVMVTLDYAKKTSSTNNQLVDLQQNIRSSAKLLSDDVIILGQDFMGQVDDDLVYVRRGFLTANDFPETDLIDPTGTSYDILLATQGANNVNSTQPILGRDNNANPTSFLRVSPGAGPAVAGDGDYVPAFGTGTDQLMFVQADYVTFRFDDDYGLVQPDDNTDDELAEAKFLAQANFAGSNLTLSPIDAGGTPSNLDTLATNALKDSGDALLAKRLVPFVDTLILRNQGGGAQFMGLVTAVDLSNGNITLSFDDDPIQLTPNWNLALTTGPVGPQKLCGQGDTVSVRRGRILRYFVGSYINPTPGIPADFCALYRRDGARVDTVAFGIENLQCSYLLIDEKTLVGGKGQFYIVPGPQLASLDADPPTPTPPATRPEGRRWNRTAIRSIRGRLFARSDEKDLSLNGPGGVRGEYLRANQEVTISLRNSSYNR